MLPTRFEVDGARYYSPGDNPNVAFPSVTTILSRTSSESSKKALLSWSAKNPGAKEAAAARGTAIHKACEDYIRGRPVDLPGEYEPYWRGLPEQLDLYDSFVWSERPLRAQWEHCVGGDGISRLWSHRHEYCGCPDLIGFKNGLAVLADYKTSVGPYCRSFPSGKDRAKLDKDSRLTFSGWMKFNKCALQLAAYAIAAEETLGLRIDAAEILVSTPDMSQKFILLGHELQSYRYRWLQRVRKFKDMAEAEGAIPPRLETRRLVAA